MVMDANESTGAPTLEQLMQLGMQTARQGNKQNARMFFQKVLETDAHNERAWLWMAAVAETPTERLRYLNTVLRINPENATALRQIAQMRRRQESSTNQVLVYGSIGLAVALILMVLAVLVLIVA